MSETPFDKAAKTYDTAFTNTFVGKAQRRIVWDHLDRYWNAHGKSLRILELNCGTGEDAIYLSKNGHQVLATDLSPQMIQLAKSKSERGDSSNLSFKILDVNDVSHLDGPFDLIFSNFGGLNCLSPQALCTLGKEVHTLLSPQGQFWAVFMSRKCFWEQVYFLFKRNTRARNRRLSKGPLEIMVNNTSVPTWFYSPKESRECFSPSLKHGFTKPLGFGIPPSYLNPMFEKNWVLRSLAIGIEHVFGNFSWLSNRADHFLITFIKV